MGFVLGFPEDCGWGVASYKEQSNVIQELVDTTKRSNTPRGVDWTIKAGYRKVVQHLLPVYPLGYGVGCRV